MNFELIRVETEELQQYKADMQAAFQKGFEDVFGKTDSVILPETDIDQSLNAEGAVAYKAVVDGKMVGGAVVVIDKSTQHNHLDLLFVKNGIQSKGIGKKIWCVRHRVFLIEKLRNMKTADIHIKMNIASVKVRCTGFPHLRTWVHLLQLKPDLFADSLTLNTVLNKQQIKMIVLSAFVDGKMVGKIGRAHV